VEALPGVKERVAGARAPPATSRPRTTRTGRTQVAGDGWVLVGDAFGFLDPLYSSGVLLALKSGELAADAIVDGLAKGDTSPRSSGSWGPGFNEGVDRMRRLVCEYYDGFSFGKFVRSTPDLRGTLTDLLIGDLFTDRVDKVWGRWSRSTAQARANTVVGIISKTAVTLLWAVAIVMSLRELGFDITPILAGAGVVGLAVGFGAQNLVRDVISGVFMLIENQIRVNDVAIINGTGGLVEEINLRTTVLRSADGVVHVFPNGTITTLSNMTREFSYYVIDMGVAYKEDTDRVVQVMQEVAAQLQTEEPFKDLILEPLEVQGVDRFADSAVIIKARIKTLPIRQWTVGRELNRRLKKRFDELGIEIPFPQRTLRIGGDRPLEVRMALPDREQLKTLVREVLEEGGTRAGGRGER
jgi:moderate conductance mechanosensitive channel